MREELEAEVQKLLATENELDHELEGMISKLGSGRYVQLEAQSNDLSSSIAKIDSFFPAFEAMESGCDKLAKQLEDCRGLSDRLSTLVRRLDTIQISAQRALACTQDIISMKDYHVGLKGAVAQRDLPKAVGILRRVHEMDLETAEAADEFQDIKALETTLNTLVKDEFAVAIRGSSVDQVLLLCPLLQALGLEKTARDDFLTFMETQAFIAVSADAVSGDDTSDPGTAYAQSLSNVFNTASLILQQYLPSVIQGLEKADGDVYFIRKLHSQCEKEAGVVLKRYVKFRGLKDLTAALKRDTATSGRSSQAQGDQRASPGRDAADIHTVLDELALLLQYCGMYSTYLRTICASAEERRGEGYRVFSGATDFDKMVTELTGRYYIEGERWIMQHSVKGAAQHLDETFFVLQRCALRAAATHSPEAMTTVLQLITSIVSMDLKKEIMEQLATAVSRTAATAHSRIAVAVKDSMGNGGGGGGSGGGADGGAGDGLDGSLRSVLGLDSTSSASASPLQTSQGESPLSDAFSTVSKCARYTDRLGREVGETVGEMIQRQPADESAASDRLRECHHAFIALSGSFAGMLRKGASVLSGKLAVSAQVILNAVMERGGRSVSEGAAGGRGSGGSNLGVRFELEDDAFDAQPGASLLAQNLSQLFMLLLRSVAEDLSENHRELVVTVVAEMVCEKLEQVVNRCTFSFAGALKFEECVRAVQGAFGHYAGASVRGAFSRIREILIVLTTESTDGSSVGYASFSHLTTSEVQAFAALRASK